MQHSQMKEEDMSEQLRRRACVALFRDPITSVHMRKEEGVLMHPQDPPGICPEDVQKGTSSDISCSGLALSSDDLLSLKTLLSFCFVTINVLCMYRSVKSCKGTGVTEAGVQS